MLTFEEAWKLTSMISTDAAYRPEECKALFDLAMTVPKRSTVLEVGCEFGRSTSILAQVAKERSLELVLIDPFVTDPENQPWRSCIAMLLKVGHPFTLHCMRTEEVLELPRHLSLIHIDGDHSTYGVETDCICLLPLSGSNARLAVHDYGIDSLPDVYPTLNRYTKLDWEQLGVVGTLGMWRKK